MMRTMTYRFEEVKITRHKNVKCAGGCGRRLRRQASFYQTINPFNKTKDGRIKDRSDILPEIEAKAEEWEKKPEICKHCKEALDRK